MSLAEDDILRRVSAVMRTTFGLPAGYVASAETTSADIDGWDSLSHSILILGIEEQFGVELPMDRAFELHDVGELMELIQEAGGGNGAD
jgi:acyl carrier protein